MSKGKHHEEVDQEMLGLTHRKATAESELQSAREIASIQDAEEKRASVRALMAVLEPISVSLPDDTISLWNYAIHELNIAATSTAKAGLAFLVLKERAGHGNFLPELEARDINPRTAQNAMSVAQFLLKLPPSNAKTMAHLSGSKLIELARLPEEELQEIGGLELFSGTKLDELDRMSVRELKDKIRIIKEKHQREMDLKNRDIERKDREIIDLEGHVKDLNAQQLPPDETEQAALNHIQSLYIQIESIVASVQKSILHGELANTSVRVQTATAHLCEYMEKVGYALFTEVRYQDSKIWVQATPTENEIYEGREAESTAREKLEASLDLQPFK